MEKPYKLYENRTYQTWQIKWKDEAGAWKTKSLPVKIKDRHDAELFAAAWFPNRSIKHYEPPPQPVTILDIVDRWVAYRKAKPAADDRDWKEAVSFRKVWIAERPIAKLLADSLTLADCVRFVEDVMRTPDRKPKTKQSVCQLLRGCIADARGHGWMSPERPNHMMDPYVTRLTRGVGDGVIVHFTKEQALAIVNAPQSCEVALGRHARYVLAICTGLRAGELSGLSWQHLNLDAKVPTVEVTRQLSARGAMKPPKKRSFRTIPLHPCAVAVLRRWKAQATTEAVFPGINGEHVYTHLSRYLQGDLPSYGLPLLFEGEHPFTFHATRRTFLTLLTDGGVHPDDVRDLAGHAAKGVTRKAYVAKHLERFAQAIAKLPFSPPPLRKTGKVIDIASRRKRTA